MQLLRSALALAALTSVALSQVTIPPHSSTYNGYTRGYYFVAQTNFNIVQLELPTNAYQAGDTAGFLVRVNGATALRSVGNPTATISTFIPIAIGDTVDILGNWSPAATGNFTAHNSYTASMTNFATTIEGVPHTIQRSGWQWDIGDANYTSGAYLAPTTGQMGRILMYTSTSGGGTVLATATPVGAGCVNRASATFYETFAAGTFDLSNTAWQMIPTGTGYLVLPTANNWWTPVGANIGLTDDSVSAALPLGFTLNYPGGSTTDVYASSNGFVWAQANTANGCCTGDPAGFVAGAARWSPLWNDLNPGAGGTVVWDQDPINGAAYLTYTNVPEYATSNLNTFQVAFFSSGVVEMRFQSCSILSHQVLTGWTPGNSLDPGSIDISAQATIVTQPDLRSLAFTSSARPIGGTSINLITSNVPIPAPFGAVLVGFSNPNLPLAGFGMPGCTQYSDGLATLLFFPTGSSHSMAFSVPNYPGVTLHTQSAVYAPASGATPLGAVASNGITLLIGDY